MKHFSKLGLLFVGGYAVFIAVIVYYIFTCNAELGFCGLAIILPLMPWPMLMGEVIPRSHMLFGLLNSAFGSFVFLLLNIIIIYFIGALIGHVVNKISRRNSLSSLN